MDISGALAQTNGFEICVVIQCGEWPQAIHVPVRAIEAERARKHVSLRLVLLVHGVSYVIGQIIASIDNRLPPAYQAGFDNTRWLRCLASI
jgi:hypothetical protein